VKSINGHIVGFVVGIAAAAIAAAVGSQGMGGHLGREAAQMAGFGGFVVGYAIGFLIGTLPIFPVESPTPATKRVEGPRQVVGQPCAVCGQKIVFLMDGTACPKCQTIYHNECAGNCPKCAPALPSS